jgi:hypothetical protein
MLEVGFRTRQYEGESFSRPDCLFDHLICFTGEATVLNSNEGSVAGKRLENPFDCCWLSISAPFNEDSSLRLDYFNVNLDRKVLHLPVPLNLLPNLKPAASRGKPESRSDSWFNESFEDIRNRFSNLHLGFGNWSAV